MNKSFPKISVIIPSFNQGEYIQRTISSILSQNYPNLECLVMDGGSTDNTIDILNRYGTNIIWESKTDNGQANAVNKGIQKSTGEVIAWINSDDTYEPETLMTIGQTFKDNSDISLVYGKANYIDKNDRYLRPYDVKNFTSQSELVEHLSKFCCMCQPAVFFRKSIVEQHGYLDETLYNCMDYEYWMRLAKHEKFLYIDQVFSNFRMYRENKSIKSRANLYNEVIQSIKKHYGYVPIYTAAGLSDYHLRQGDQFFETSTPVSIQLILFTLFNLLKHNIATLSGCQYLLWKLPTDTYLLPYSQQRLFSNNQ